MGLVETDKIIGGIYEYCGCWDWICRPGYRYLPGRVWEYCILCGY